MGLRSKNIVGRFFENLLLHTVRLQKNELTFKRLEEFDLSSILAVLIFRIAEVVAVIIGSHFFDLLCRKSEKVMEKMNIQKKYVLNN